MSADTEAHQEVFSCRVCTAPVFDDEPFCEVCGAAAPGDPVAPPEPARRRSADREELDLGVVAAVSDRGHRRLRNEDSVRIARVGDWSVLVVCDGVASTANAHLAADAAADAAASLLEELLGRPEGAGTDFLGDAIGRAFGAAEVAVGRVPQGDPDGIDLAPSTTMVVAVATPEQVVVGSVGDSRAYWVSRAPGRSRLLTVDDSWAQAGIAEGMDPELAYADPDAQALTRWIGADSESSQPALVVLEVTEPGVLVVCSDGLWNYFEEPGDLAGLLDAAAGAPLVLARRLTEAALSAGGHDNVTVAVLPIDPSGAGPRSPNEE